jgi:NAD+ kinase
MSLRRIAIVVHPSRDIRRAVATVREWAGERGIELVQLRTNRDELGHAPEGPIDGAGLVVAIGGDGTVLAALRAAAPHDLPVLGIACGSLGALTSVGAADVRAALERFEAGDWVPARLPALEVGAAGGTAHVAINDFVVVRAGGNQISTEVEVDAELYGRFAGDGVIASTQLGSTAYALAAGGPVLAPGSDAWLVTPLAPHGGCLPPVVVGARSRVTLAVEPGHGGARVELDGHPTGMPAGRFDLALRPDAATLVRLGGEEPFLAGLRRRQILIDSPRILARDRRAAVTPSA